MMCKKRFMVMMLGVLILSACSNSGKEGVEPSKSETKAPTSSDSAQQKVPESATPTNEADLWKTKLLEPVELTIVKELPQDAKLADGDTIENNKYTRYLSDKLNVKFKVLWQAAQGSDYEQKLKLSIASEDIPDVLVVDEKTFRALAEAGQIEDLTETYDKYAAPILRDLYASRDNVALKNATIDGKLMAIPSSNVAGDSTSMLWIRQDWLDKVGLPGPKTVADVEAIAKAFIEQDPDQDGKKDTIGLIGNKDNLASGPSSFEGLFDAYRSYPDAWLRDENGKLVNGSTMPQTKEALGKLREMYAAGLIDKEFALRKDPMELISGGKAGMVFGSWWESWPLGDSVKNDPKAEWKPYFIYDSQGQKTYRESPPSYQFLVVKKGVQHPEAALLAMGIFVHAGRGSDELAREIQQKTGVEVDATTYHYAPINIAADYSDAVPRKHDLMTKVISGEINAGTLSGEQKRLAETALRYKADPKKNVDDWMGTVGYLLGGELLNEKPTPVYSLYNISTKTMDRKGANLKKLETETFYKIILDKEPLEAFDRFVADWKKQGGDEITQEIEEALAKQGK